MAAEFKGKRAATEEAQKILRRQIEKGLSCLEGRRLSDERIHRARKQIKMARATLRLMRTGLSDKHYHAENRRLRDAAKPLSAARDAAVVRKTFQHIQARACVPGLREEALEIERMLAGEQSSAHRQVADRRGIPRSRRLLQKSRARASRWDLHKEGWSTIGAGLRLVYRRGRRILRAVRSKPSDTGFHEWRKQVKYLRHQIQLLRPTWPGRLNTLARELHTLSDQLGDDHDLVVLRTKLTAKGLPRAAKLARQARQAWLASLDSHRADLQRKALAMGMRIYEESPVLFCSRLRQHWREWRGA
jgi:CHAD domain-containing protein